MTTETKANPPAEQPVPARKPSRLARLMRGLRGLHLPARAAIATAVLLVLLLAVVVSLYLFHPDHVPWRHSLSIERIVVVILLTVAIPFVVYHGLRLWLEGEQSRFPEIDFAWQSGLSALEQNGLSIDAIPLFLVLGSAGESFEQSLLAASGMNFRVRGVPDGPAPLHWYANPDGIFLFSNDVGWLSALVVRKQSAAGLASEESAEQVQRLEYLCLLIRRIRHPLCGINGLLTLLPFELLLPPQRTQDELRKALQTDLAIIRGELRLQCPVTTLISGMEQERGFQELVRRAGPDRASIERFGNGFDLRAIPTRDELAALCLHVRGTFEDWIYEFFREEGVLSRPGNRHLYELLGKIRGDVKHRLEAVLTGGYGSDPQKSSTEPLLYSGCYFAASGESEDRQAFVRGLFDKLEEEQEEIQWTPHALASESRDRWLAATGFTVCAALTLTLGLMVIQTMFWRG